MSWPLTTLDHIFEIARGGSPRPIDQFITDADDGVNWIMIGDASNSAKHIRQTKKKIKPTGVSRSRLVKPGDFLLTNSMSFGRPYILDTHGCIHDGWLVLSPREANVDHDYFYHLLGSPAIFGQFEKLAAGATVKNLNIDLVKSVVVALPPLEEQKRIAAILDQADELRRKRQRALDRLNQLGQAIFHKMFGDPVTNPKNFQIQKFGDIGILDRGISKHRPRNDPALLVGAHPLIQTGDVANSDGYIDSFSSTYSDLGLRQSRKWPKGTLCITIAANIGKTAILEIDACFPDSIVGFTPGPNTNAEYVQFWMRRIQKRLEEIAPQSAQKNINLAILRDLPIPMPPRNSQDEFRDCIHAIKKQSASLRNAQDEVVKLFHAIQHQAFRGKLS